jgi:hypothetical protein
MAEIFTINIELTFEGQKLLKIPELIEVPKGSIVQWNIKSFEEYKHILNRPFGSLIFTLYFENKSPFKWKRTFIQLFDTHFESFYPKTFRLADDVADKKGDFKYGVSVFDAEQNEPVYDEDPLLRVF